MKRALFLAALVGLLFFAFGCMHGTEDEQGAPTDDDVSDDDTTDDDTGPELESITVEPPYAGVPVNTTQKFKALGHYSDGTDSYLLGATWSVSDESIATIDKDGNLTSVADGVVTVTATKGGISGQAAAYCKPDNLVIDSFGAGIAAVDRVSGGVLEYLFTGGIGAMPNRIKVYDEKVFVVDSNPAGETGFLIYIDLADLFGSVKGRVNTTEIALTGCKNPWDFLFVGDYAYVSCTLSDKVVKVDLSAKGVVDTIELPENSAPQDMAYDGEKLFVVATYYDYSTFTANLGSVIVISNDTVEEEVETGDYNPTTCALNADATKLYVSNTDWAEFSGSITVIDLSNYSTSEIALGMAPGPLALAQNDKLFVGEQMSGFVYVIDTTDDSVIVGDTDPITIPDSFWVHNIRYISDADSVYVLDFGNKKVYPLAPDDYELGEPFVFNLAYPQDASYF